MGTFRSSCPHCGEPLDLQDEWANMEGSCPNCNKTFIIPENPANKQDQSQKPPQKTIDLTTFIPSPLAIAAVILSFAALLLYLTRNLGESLYTAIGIPAAALLMVFVSLVLAIIALKKMGSVKIGTLVLSIIAILLMPLFSYLFVYFPMEELLPTPYKLEKMVVGQKTAKYFPIYSMTDKDSKIIKAKVKKNSFLHYSALYTIERNGKQIVRPVKIEIKYVNGKLSTKNILDVNYTENKKMLQEDSDLFLNIEFDKEEYPQFATAKLIKVEASQEKKGILLYTIEIDGKQTEIEVPISSFKQVEHLTGTKFSVRVLLWRNEEWYYNQALMYRDGVKVALNETKAFRYFEKSAKLGHKKAALELSKCYINGFGVKIDKKKGVEIVQKLAYAKPADQEAQLLLSEFYFSGMGVVQNPRKGLDLLKELIAKGNIEAIFRMALIYKEGIFVKGDETKALKGMKEAAFGNHPKALFYLGHFYREGVGMREYDNVRAFKNFEHAAKLGDKEASIWENYCIFYGEGTEKSRDIATQGLKSLAVSGYPTAQRLYAYICLVKDIYYTDRLTIWKSIDANPVKKREAFGWFRKAANAGDAQAKLDLGCCYALGIGCDPNMDLAQDNWRKALDADVKLYEVLIELLDTKALPSDGRYGHGKNNDEEAAYWLKKAANEQEYPDAQIELATRYMHGKGVPIDIETAKDLLENAVRINPAKGLLISRYYKNGENRFAKQPKLAFYWMKKAADKGVINGMLGLAYYYSEGIGRKKNEKESFKWAKKAANQNDPYAQYLLGGIYFYGIGTEKNLKEARRCFDMASEQHESRAMYMIAEHFCGRNEKEKFDWMKKAAEHEHYNGQYQLARYFQEGYGTEKNEKQAFYWMAKAAEQKKTDEFMTGEAQLALAEYYKNGFGTEADSGKEFYWLTQASKNGFAQAQFLLAKEYWDGTRIEEDKMQTAKLLLLAIKQGHEEAGNWAVDHVREINPEEKAWELIRTAATVRIQGKKEPNPKAWNWILQQSNKEHQPIWNWVKKEATAGNPQAWNCIRIMADSGKRHAWDWIEKETHNANKTVWDWLVQTAEKGNPTAKNRANILLKPFPVAMLRKAEKGDENTWKKIEIKVSKGEFPIIWGWLQKEAENGNAKAWRFLTDAAMLKKIGAAWNVIFKITEKGHNYAWEWLLKIAEEKKNSKSAELSKWIKDKVRQGDRKIIHFVLRKAESGNKYVWEIIQEAAKDDLRDRSPKKIYGWALVTILIEKGNSEALKWVFDAVENRIGGDIPLYYLGELAKDNNMRVWAWIEKKVNQKNDFPPVWKCCEKLTLEGNSKAWNLIRDNAYKKKNGSWKVLTSLATRNFSKAWNKLQTDFENHKKEAWELTITLAAKGDIQGAWTSLQSAAIRGNGNALAWLMYQATTLDHPDRLSAKEKIKNERLVKRAINCIKEVVKSGKNPRAFDWVCERARDGYKNEQKMLKELADSGMKEAIYWIETQARGSGGWAQTYLYERKRKQR